MRRLLARAAAILGIVAAAALYSSCYVVSEGQQALITQFGRPVGVETEPGLKFAWPFVDTVTWYDTALHAIEPPTDLIILGDQKRVEIDTYSQFRIVDPLRFSQSVRTIDEARSRLTQIISSSLRRVLGAVTLPALLSTQRDAIIGDIRQDVAATARPLGVEIVEVRIRRADLPPETSQAIYDRMTSERRREATELRAQGFEWAQEIEAKADRERSVILAEAQLKARIARSEGDAEASRLFADAFGQNVKFFTFYRAMESYRHALADSTPMLVLTPQSELLKFFNAGTP
ncbi:MAG: protease modulator HflC [Beijerinckiaceae bacterium]